MANDRFERGQIIIQHGHAQSENAVRYPGFDKPSIKGRRGCLHQFIGGQSHAFRRWCKQGKEQRALRRSRRTRGS